jgi:hypothetical protein
MRSALADTTDSLPHGYAKGMNARLTEALNRLDPVGQRMRKQRSPGVRHKANVIHGLGEIELLRELLRRASETRRRKLTRQRVAAHRERKAT